MVAAGVEAMYTWLGVRVTLVNCCGLCAASCCWTSRGIVGVASSEMPSDSLLSLQSLISSSSSKYCVSSGDRIRGTNGGSNCCSRSYGMPLNHLWALMSSPSRGKTYLPLRSRALLEELLGKSSVERKAFVFLNLGTEAAMSLNL